jgi:hypothetical protein
LLEEVLLLDVREDEYTPAMPRAAIRAKKIGRWVVVVVTLAVVGDRQRELLEVSMARHTCGGVSHTLHAPRDAVAARADYSCDRETAELATSEWRGHRVTSFPGRRQGIGHRRP